MKKSLLTLCALALLATIASAQNAARISVAVDRPGAKVSPVLWGVFFEEINCAGDGGLYAELVRNRSFEETEKPDHWTAVGKAELAVAPREPATQFNRRALRLTVAGGPGGVANGGYWGIAVVEGAKYLVSLDVRGESPAPLVVALQSADGKRIYAQTRIENVEPVWSRRQATLTATATDPKARLVVLLEKPGTVLLDMVSLFPAKTWKERPNGLRPDLAEMLVGLRPAFVRFPGGCWVEGDRLEFATRWKRTIGDPADRWTQWNIWHYYSTNGLGYHEYLQMCEDLGAEPLFVINCGMSHKENVPMDQMAEWVQDSLDAIEYANGPVESHYGGLRAKHGHPQPFHLKYMEIGNENGGPAYQERYALFYDAIKKKHPEMILISNVPTTSRPADIIDEHYYSSPEFFMQQAHRYDTYKRGGPKIYVGEYAVTANAGKGHLRAALGEAAFMTGMERNSDVVAMASYAPLFVNVNHRGWNPDLIAFDSSRAHGIPSYYVQKLFAEHRPDVVLPMTLDVPPLPVKEPARGGVGVGTWHTQAEYKDLKVVQNGKTVFQSDFTKPLSGWKQHGGRWAVKDGVLRQTEQSDDIYLTTGDPQWSDCTYTLKARKLAGAEGFLILFQVRDGQNWVWWNLGGWGNARHGIEKCEGGAKSPVGHSVDGQIETGRWYDIRIELAGPRIRCYLDGKLIHDVASQPVDRVYATAGKTAGGEVIVKVVNVSAEPVTAAVELTGVAAVEPEATAIVLTSASPIDENNLEEPTKVAPKAMKIRADRTFTHAFPAHSLTVLRMKAKGP